MDSGAREAGPAELPSEGRSLRKAAALHRMPGLMAANLVMLVSGVVGGASGFAYHAIAARMLWPELYGEVASLIAVFTIAIAPTFVLILVLAHRAATLTSQHDAGGIRVLALSTTRSLILPCMAVTALGVVLAAPAAAFLRLGSPVPVAILGVTVASTWLLAVPRGALQGSQRFTALSANLSSEMMIRSLILVPILLGGLAASGAMTAVLVGVLLALCLGVWSLRDLPATPAGRVRQPGTASLSVAATVATAGVLLLFNVDVVLAKHYLDPQEAGVYASLNKTGSIIYFLTLGVSQVMFPKVVGRDTSKASPGRVLFQSFGLLCGISVVPLLLFAGAPSLVVRGLFGPGFLAVVPVMPLAGLIGLGVSCVNMVVQFLVAIRDLWFIPVLISGAMLEVTLIVWRHHSVAAIATDVVVAVLTLLLLLVARCALLLRHESRGGRFGRHYH